jgi:hypothetical protein
MNTELQTRELTFDELTAVSGGKRKVQLIIIERCTTTIGKDGRETQKCRQVHEQG